MTTELYEATDEDCQLLFTLFPFYCGGGKFKSKRPAVYCLCEIRFCERLNDGEGSVQLDAEGRGIVSGQIAARFSAVGG